MALTQSDNAINAYEGFKQSYGNTAMYNALGGDKGLSDAIASGNSGYANSFLSAVMDADKLGSVNSFKSSYRTDFLDNNDKLTAAVNELYGDRITQNEYTRYKTDDNGNYELDDDGNPIEETYYDTEYNYTKSALNERAEQGYQNFLIECEQAIKDGWSGWRKFWSATGSFLMNLGADVLDTIKDDLMFIGVGIESIWNRGALQRYYRNEGEFEGWGAGILSDLMADFDTQYTVLRKADGTTTGIGNVLYGVANTFGVMIPSMLTNLIPVAGAAGSVGAIIGNVAKQSVYWFSLGVGNIKDYMIASPDASFTQICLTSFGVAACQAAVTYVNSFMFGGTFLEKLTLGINTEGGGLFGALSSSLRGLGGGAGKFFKSGIGRFVTDFLIEGTKQWYEEEWQERCQAWVEAFSAHCNNNFNQIFELSGEQYLNAMAMSFLTSFISTGFKWAGAACNRIDDVSAPLFKNGDVVYNEKYLDENGNLKEGVDPTKAIKYKKMSTVKSMDYKSMMRQVIQLATDINNTVEKYNAYTITENTSTSRTYSNLDYDVSTQKTEERTEYVNTGTTKEIEKLKIKMTALVNAMTIMGQFYNQAGETNFKQGLDTLNKITEYSDHLDEIMKKGGYVAYITDMLQNAYTNAVIDAAVANKLTAERITKLRCIIDPSYKMQTEINQMVDEAMAAAIEEQQTKMDDLLKKAQTGDANAAAEYTDAVLPMEREQQKIAQKTVDDVTKKYNEAKKNATSAKSAVTKARNKIESLQKQKDGVQQQKDTAERAKKRAENTLKTAKKQDVITKNEGIIKKNAEIISSCDERIAYLNDEIAKQNKIIENSNVDNLTADAEMLKADKEQADKELADITEVVNAHTEVNEKAKILQEYETARDQVTQEYQNKITEADNTVSELTDKVNALADEVTNTTDADRVDELNGQINDLNKQIYEAETERDAIKNEMNTSGKANSKFDERVGEVMTENAQKNAPQETVPTEEKRTVVEESYKAAIREVDDFHTAYDTSYNEAKTAIKNEQKSSDILKKEIAKRLVASEQERINEQAETTAQNAIEQNNRALEKAENEQKNIKSQIETAETTELENTKMAVKARLTDEALQEAEAEANAKDAELQKQHEAYESLQNEYNDLVNKDIPTAEAKTSNAINQASLTDKEQIVESLIEQAEQYAKELTDQAKYNYEKENAKSRKERKALGEAPTVGNYETAVMEMAQLLKSIESTNKYENVKNGITTKSAGDTLRDLIRESHNISTNQLEADAKGLFNAVLDELRKRANENTYYNLLIPQVEAIVNAINNSDTPVFEALASQAPYIKAITNEEQEAVNYAMVLDSVHWNERLKDGEENARRYFKDTIKRANFGRNNIDEIEDALHQFIAEHMYGDPSMTYYDVYKAMSDSIADYDIHDIVNRQMAANEAMAGTRELFEKAKNVIYNREINYNGHTEKLSDVLALESYGQYLDEYKGGRQGYEVTLERVKNDSDLRSLYTTVNFNKIKNRYNAFIGKQQVSPYVTKAYSIADNSDIIKNNLVAANDAQQEHERLVNRAQELSKQINDIPAEVKNYNGEHTEVKPREITDEEINNSKEVQAVEAKIKELNTKNAELIEEINNLKKAPKTEKAKKVTVKDISNEEIEADQEWKNHVAELEKYRNTIKDYEAKLDKLIQTRDSIKQELDDMSAEAVETRNEQAKSDAIENVMQIFKPVEEVNETDVLDTGDMNVEDITETGEEEVNKVKYKKFGPFIYKNDIKARMEAARNDTVEYKSEFDKIYNDTDAAEIEERNKIKIKQLQKAIGKDNVVVITDDGKDAVISKFNGKWTIFIPYTKLETQSANVIFRDAVMQDVLYTIATSDVSTPYIEKLVKLFDEIYHPAEDRVADFKQLGDAASMDAAVNVVANLLTNNNFLEQALIKYGEEVLQYIAALPKMIERMDIVNAETTKMTAQMYGKVSDVIKRMTKSSLIKFLSQHGYSDRYSSNVGLLSMAHELSILTDEDFYKIFHAKDKNSLITKTKDKIKQFSHEFATVPDSFTPAQIDRYIHDLALLNNFLCIGKTRINPVYSRLRSRISDLINNLENAKTVSRYLNWIVNNWFTQDELKLINDATSNDSNVSIFIENNINDITYTPMFDTMRDEQGRHIYLQNHGVPAVAFNQMLRQYGLTAFDISALGTADDTKASDIYHKFNDTFKQALKPYLNTAVISASNLANAIRNLFKDRTGFEMVYAGNSITFNENYTNIIYQSKHNISLENYVNALPPKRQQEVVDRLLSSNVSADMRAYITLEDIILNPNELLDSKYKEDIIQSFIKASDDAVGTPLTYNKSRLVNTYNTYKYLQRELIKENIDISIMRGRIVLSDITNTYDAMAPGLKRFDLYGDVDVNGMYASGKDHIHLSDLAEALKDNVDVPDKFVAAYKQAFGTTEGVGQYYVESFLLDARNHTPERAPETNLIVNVAKIPLTWFFNKNTSEGKMYRQLLENAFLYIIPDYSDTVTSVRGGSYKYTPPSSSSIPRYTVEYDELQKNQKVLEDASNMGMTGATPMDAIKEPYILVYGNTLSLDTIFHEAIHMLQIRYYYNMYSPNYNCGEELEQICSSCGLYGTAIDPKFGTIYINTITDLMVDMIEHDQISEAEAQRTSNSDMAKRLHAADYSTVIDHIEQGALSKSDKTTLVIIFNSMFYKRSFDERMAWRLLETDTIDADVMKIANTTSHRKLVLYMPWGNSYEFILPVNTITFGNVIISKTLNRRMNNYSMGYSEGMQDVFDKTTRTDNTYIALQQNELRKSMVESVNKTKGTTSALNNIYRDMQTKAANEGSNYTKTVSLSTAKDRIDKILSTADEDDNLTLSQRELYDAIRGIYEGFVSGANTLVNDYSSATRVTSKLTRHNVINRETNQYEAVKVTDDDINRVLGYGTPLYDAIHQYMYRAVCGENPSMTYNEFLNLSVPYYISTMSKNTEEFNATEGPKVSYYMGGIAQLDNNISLDKVLNTQYNSTTYRVAKGKLVFGMIRVGDILCSNSEGISMIDLRKMRSRSWANVFNGEMTPDEETGDNYINIVPTSEDKSDNTNRILVQNARGVSLPMSIDEFKLNGRYVNYSKNITSRDIIFDTDQNKIYVIYHETDRETGQYISKILMEPLYNNTHLITDPEWQKVVAKTDNINLKSALRNKGQFMKTAIALMRDPNTDIIFKEKLQQAIQNEPSFNYHVESDGTITTIDKAIMSVNNNRINSVNFVKQGENVLIKDEVSGALYDSSSLDWFVEQHPEQQEQEGDTSAKLPDDIEQQENIGDVYGKTTREVDTLKDFTDIVDENVTNVLSDTALAKFVNAQPDQIASAMSKMSYETYTTLRAQLAVYIYKMFDDEDMYNSAAFPLAKIKAINLATQVHRTAAYTSVGILSESLKEFYQYEANKVKHDANDDLLYSYLMDRQNGEKFANSLEHSTVGQLQLLRHDVSTIDFIQDYIDWCLNKDENASVDLLLPDIIRLYRLLDDDVAAINASLLSAAYQNRLILNTHTDISNYLVLSHVDKVTVVEALPTDDILQLRDTLDAYAQLAMRMDSTLILDLYNVINTELTHRIMSKSESAFDINKRMSWLSLVAGKNMTDSIQPTGESIAASVKGSYSRTDLKQFELISDSSQDKSLMKALVAIVFDTTDPFLPTNDMAKNDTPEKIKTAAKTNKSKSLKQRDAEARQIDAITGSRPITNAPIFDILNKYTYEQLNTIVLEMWTKMYQMAVGEKPTGAFTLESYHTFNDALLAKEEEYAEYKKTKKNNANERRKISDKYKAHKGDENNPYTYDQSQADMAAIKDPARIPNIVAIYNTLYKPLLKSIAAYQAYQTILGTNNTVHMSNILSDIYSIMFASKITQYDYVFNNISDTELGVYYALIRDARSKLAENINTDAAIARMNNALANVEDVIKDVMDEKLNNYDGMSGIGDHYRTVIGDDLDVDNINSMYDGLVQALSEYDLDNIEREVTTAQEMPSARKVTRKQRADTRLDFFKRIGSVKIAGSSQEYVLTDRAVPYMKGANTNIEKLGFFKNGTVCEMSLAMQAFIVSSELDKLSPIVVDTIRETNKTGVFDSADISSIMYNDIDELNNYTFMQINKYFYQNSYIHSLDEYKDMIYNFGAERAWEVDTVVRYLKDPNGSNVNRHYISPNDVVGINPNALDSIINVDAPYDKTTIDTVIHTMAQTPRIRMLLDIAQNLALAMGYYITPKNSNVRSKNTFGLNNNALGIMILNNYLGDTASLAACYAMQRYVETSNFWNIKEGVGETEGKNWAFLSAQAFKRAWATTHDFSMTGDTEKASSAEGRQAAMGNNAAENAIIESIDRSDESTDVMEDDYDDNDVAGDLMDAAETMALIQTRQISRLVHEVTASKKRNALYTAQMDSALNNFIVLLTDSKIGDTELRERYIEIFEKYAGYGGQELEALESILSDQQLKAMRKYYKEHGLESFYDEFQDLDAILQVEIMAHIMQLDEDQLDVEYLNMQNVDQNETDILQNTPNAQQLREITKTNKINRQSLRRQVNNRIIKLAQGYANNGKALEQLYKDIPEIFVDDPNNGGMIISTATTKRMNEKILTDLNTRLEKAVTDMNWDAKYKAAISENMALAAEVKRQKSIATSKQKTISKQNKTISKQENTIEQQKRTIEIQAAEEDKLIYQVQELTMKNKNKSFVFGMKSNDMVQVPDALKRILTNTVPIEEETPANVQLGDAGQAFSSHDAYVFLSANRSIFMEMTQADWDEVIDYYCSEMGAIPITGDMDALITYEVYRVWILAYAQMNVKDGLFATTVDRELMLDEELNFDDTTKNKLNTALEQFGSEAGRYLNAFKQAMDIADPRREMIMEMARAIGVNKVVFYDTQGNPINAKQQQKRYLIDAKTGKPVTANGVKFRFMAAKTMEVTASDNPMYHDLEDAINLMGDLVIASVGDVYNMTILENMGLNIELIKQKFSKDIKDDMLTITRENKPVLLGEAIQMAANIDIQQAKAKGNRSALDKVFAWEQMCMLSWPGTWIRNLSSNIILMATNAAADRIGSLFGKGKRTKQKLEIINNAVEAYNTANPKKPMDHYMYQIVGTKVPDDMKQAVHNLLNDTLIVDPTTSKHENVSFWHVLSSSASKYNDMNRTIRGHSASVGDKLVKLILNNLTTKVMNQHKFSSETNNHAKEQIENVLNKTSSMLFKALSDDIWIKKTTTSLFERMLTERGIEPAQVTYMNDIVISMFADAYTEASWQYMHKASPMFSLDKIIRQKLGKGGWFVWKQMMPFANATWNWGMEALSYSPVGLVRGIYQLCKLEKSFGRTVNKMEMFENTPSGNFTLYNARKMIGKGVLGTLLMGLGAMAAAFGIIGLDKEDDKIKLCFGEDTYIDVSSLFGTSSFLAGAGMVYTLCDSDASTSEKIWSTIETVFSSLLEDSIFNSIMQSFQYSTTIGEWVEYNLVNSVCSFVPNMYRQVIANSYDFSIQYNNGMLGQLEKLGTKLIPGLAYAMPREYDIYTGESQSTYRIPFLYKWLNSLLPVEIEPYRVSDEEYIARSLGINKGLLTGQYDDIGTLNAKQRSILNQMYGKLNAQVLRDLMNNKTSVRVQNEDGSFSTLKWNRMTDTQKAAAINSLMSKNATYAKAYVYTSYMGGKYYASSTEYTTLHKYGITKNIFVATDRYSGFI